jgi:hypothetical protein
MRRQIMKEQPEVQAARLQYGDGKCYVTVLPQGGTASGMVSDGRGCLHVVSHVVNRVWADGRVCERVEDVAQETYRRSAGGVTNKLRQAVRNANKYLYLRNLVRGEDQVLLAALACVAIRDEDAYACGVGPYGVLVLSRGRLRNLGSPATTPGQQKPEDCHSNGHLIGRKAKLSDPGFSYLQLFPGDLLLLVAGGDAGPLRTAAAELGSALQGEDIEGVATRLGGFMGQQGAGSALLVRVRNGPAWPADVYGSAEANRAAVPAAVPRLINFGRLRPKSRGRGERRSRVKEGRVQSIRQGLDMKRGASSGLAETARTLDVPSLQSTKSAMGKARAKRLSERGLERLRLDGTLLISLLVALRASGLWVLTSLFGMLGRCWRWIRYRRVVERLTRACGVGIMGVLAGLKGLLIGVLPERQSTTRTYAATARPMVRARVLGFHPSGTSRAAIGALIMLLVFGLVGASAVRVKGRLDQAQIEDLVSEVEASLALADQEEGREAKIAALAEAQDLMEQAPDSQRDSDQWKRLSLSLAARWDGLTGVVRLPFALALGLEGPGTMAGGIVVRQDEIYIVDQTAQSIRRCALDQEGSVVLHDEALVIGRPGSEEAGSVPQILDMEWVDAASGRLSPALVVLTSEGSLVELGAEGSTRPVAVSGASEWQSPRALATYQGNLYVLDPGHKNIHKHVPTGDDYQQAPTDYIGASVDINWEKAVDLAIDGYVYILFSDGSVMKFAGGEPQPFAQEGLYPPLENPAGIYASPDVDSVFVVDRDGARVVEFNKEGKFVRQYRAALDEENPPESWGAFTIDGQRGRLLVGTLTGIYSASLPSLHQGE